jgi:hypothetical protein
MSAGDIKRHNPRSNRTLARLECENDPITYSTFIENKPSASFSPLALAPCLYAHADKISARLHGQIVAFPSIWHFRRRHSCERDLTYGVVFAGVAKHLR